MYDGGDDDNNDLSDAERIWLTIGIFSIIPMMFFILYLFVMLMKGCSVL